jgi:hypothetical protein
LDSLAAEGFRIPADDVSVTVRGIRAARRAGTQPVRVLSSGDTFL